MDILNDIVNIFIPVIILLSTIFVQIVLSMIKNNMKFYKSAKWISVTGILLTLIAIFNVNYEPIYYGFKNTVISNVYTVFMQALILISSLVCVLLTKKLVATRKNRAFIFHAVFLTAVLSSMLLVSVNDYLNLFIMLELLSFACYFLIAFSKGFRSKEATLKYLITNACATGVFLYGVSFLYGITGSLNFGEINDFYMSHTAEWTYTLSVVLVASGILFKLAIFPFANWILDIFENTATSVVAFLSVVPEVAVFAILCRLLVFNFSYSFEFPLILLVLASITAVWANLIAIRQKNIKRLFAASSAANASYIIFAASLVSVYNISTVIFYLVTYVFMNLGIWSAVILLEKSQFSNKLYEFRNFAYSNPMFSVAFLACLLGLAGMPFTSGFIAKVYLISAVARSGMVFVPFLFILIFAIAISLYYYTRIARLMFERSSDTEKKYFAHKTESACVVLYICAFVTITLGVTPNVLIEVCKLISYNI